MNIEGTKLELMQLLLNTKKESMLLKIKQIFDEESSSDWWEDLSEQEQNEIEEGLKQAEKDQVVSHENIMKRFDKWK